MVLSDVLRCVLYNIVCPCWFCPWYCLTFFDVLNTLKNVRQYHTQNQQVQTMLYKTHRRTSDNTITLFVLVGVGHGIFWRSLMCFVWHCLSSLVLAMVLSDVLRCVLYNIGYTKHIAGGQTIPWTKPTRTNNIIQNTSKNVRQYHGHCLSLLVLAMVLSDLVRCALYNIVFPCWFWPWYCLTFFDVLQNTSKKVRQYHGQNQQGQTMLYKTYRRT
jgi:hypothetical protein